MSVIRSHAAPPGAVAHASVLPAEREHHARGAYLFFLAFIVAVYASVSQLVPPLARLAPGQTLIALAVVGLTWSVVLCDRRLRLGLGAGGGALYLFFGLLVASLAWSLHPFYSQQAITESAKYVVAFFVAANVLDSRHRVRRATEVLVIASLFPAVGAIKGYLAGEYLVEGTRASWIGVFANPNFLAFNLVVATPLALALRDSTPRRQTARRLLWLGAVGVFAVAILLTGSRGGTLGMAAVLMLWFARGLARGRIALGAVAAVAIAIYMAPNSPWNRAETRTTLSGEVDASAKGRIDAWRTAERIVERMPFTGVGAGAFVPAYERFAPGDAESARTAHNSFLMIAAELGLPALVLFCFVLIYSFVALGRLAKRTDGPAGVIARGIQTAMFGFTVCSLTGSYVFSWPLYFILGLAAAAVAVEKRVAA